ncbi:MAG TPA: GGDEF domain-containing protein, partial [Lacipirellulaceae bacterium]|nr:GGDEF domain-containing protein [Lacipirellulaceae bacterium]
MISQTMLLILGGCLLGAFQMTAGIALGMWLRRTKSTTPPSGRHEMIHASEIAKRLRSLADDMSSSVGEHRARLDNASQLLASNEGRSGPALAELVVGVIDEIVRANHHMQSKLETAESRLQEQANEIETYISRSLTDPLTGLPNRREFDNRMEERMAAWKRRQEIFSLLIVDVDHFKKLNDQHGHLAGDQMLAAMGKALRSAIRREDAVARYGGEEFAMLLPHTSLEQGVQVAQNVRDAVARISVDHNGQQLTVTASAGLATIQTDEHAELLIHRADAALYAAKGAGRNCAFLHDGTSCQPAVGYTPDAKPTPNA